MYTRTRLDVKRRRRDEACPLRRAEADETDTDTSGEEGGRTVEPTMMKENKQDGRVICTVIVQVLCVFSLVSKPLSRRPQNAARRRAVATPAAAFTSKGGREWGGMCKHSKTKEKKNSRDFLYAVRFRARRPILSLATAA